MSSNLPACTTGARQGDIFGAGFGIAAGMVVHDDHAGCIAAG